MQTLAIHGGKPAVDVELPVVENASGRLYDGQELELVTQVVQSGRLNYLSGGTMVADFEKAFAQRWGTRYAVACSSGTAAIHTAMVALDLEPGSEVIVGPITDMGTIIPILLQNCVPVFADVDPQTSTIDPASVAAKVTDRTRAILPIHMFGHPADMDPILEIARQHNLYVIEDCCQAFLTRYKGRLCGTIGHIGCFSFQQSKHISTGDGGMVISNDEKLGPRLRLCMDKGWPRGGAFRDHLFLAPAYHMTELQAAVGIPQLRKIDTIVENRRRAAAHFNELIADIPGITPPVEYEYALHTYWKYPITVDTSDMKASMDELAAALQAEGVQCWAGYTKTPIYNYDVLTKPATYGRSGYPLRGGDREYTYGLGLCPNAEAALQRMIVLPINERYTEQHCRCVAAGLRKVFGHFAR